MLKRARFFLDGMRRPGRYNCLCFSSSARGLPSGDAETFERIVNVRRAAPSFDASKPVPEAALESILRSTLKAPSSFNVQPFKCILVKDSDVRKELAYCFSGFNTAKVLQAPITAVFLADVRPNRSVGAMIKREKERGTKENDLSKMLFDTMFLAGSTHSMGRAAAESASYITPVPSVSSAEAWAFKNTMPAVATFMLAAASHGIDTCPMEGLTDDGFAMCYVCQTDTASPLLWLRGMRVLRVRQRSSSDSTREVFSVDRFGDE